MLGWMVQPEALKDAPPSDAIEFQKVRLLDSPPTEEPICPKGGPTSGMVSTV